MRAARRAWRALPISARDALRPLLFGGGKAPALSRGQGSRQAERQAARPIVPHSSSGSLAERVSVLIPTLDGGAAFDRLLASISSQQGLRDVEVVVVDSGSADGTADAARRAGARLLSISREEFGHGRTRNYAAESSTGSVLVLLVQDALLLGRTALRDLVEELQADERVAAVSARQVPRSDADLYGAFVIYNHYRALWESNGRSARSPSAAMRAEATVDNVCAAVRRDAWEQMRFADVEFAEDLDFGVRALQGGWTLRRSERVAVAHSHTRSAAYHLRRSVADRLYVAPLVDDRAVSRAATVRMEELLAAAGVCLRELAGAVSAAPADDAPLSVHLSSICALLEAGAPRLAPSRELDETAALLDGKASRAASERVVSDLRYALLRLLESEPMETFAAACRHVSAPEAADFTAKASATVVGRVIGDALRIEPDESVRRRLLSGV